MGRIFFLTSGKRLEIHTALALTLIFLGQSVVHATFDAASTPQKRFTQRGVQFVHTFARLRPEIDTIRQLLEVIRSIEFTSVGVWLLTGKTDPSERIRLDTSTRHLQVLGTG